MTVNIYFIRHAQSEANVDPRHLIGGKNLYVGLTDEGYRQARLLGHRLQVTCDIAYSSHALRTQETARIVLDEIGYEGDLIIDKDLVERDQGDWQGRPRSLYQQPEVLRALAKDSWHFRPGDHRLGESESDVAHRMTRAIERIISDMGEGNIFIFTHAHAIRCLLSVWCNIPIKEIYIDNTSVTRLRVTNEEITCFDKWWNNTDHLH